MRCQGSNLGRPHTRQMLYCHSSLNYVRSIPFSVRDAVPVLRPNVSFWHWKKRDGAMSTEDGSGRASLVGCMLTWSGPITYIGLIYLGLILGTVICNHKWHNKDL